MPVSISLLRLAIVTASGIIYWCSVFFQARRIKKHIGRSPNLKPRTLKERFLWLGWFFVIAGWIGQPFVINTRQIFTVFIPFVHPLGLAGGCILIISGYAGTLWCYRAIGDSWRIGVNRSEKTVLIQHGPYRLVRHPIYLFQIIILTGLLFLIPSPFSLMILSVHFACVLIKAADEECYLLSVHGEQYRDYLSRSGRLAPPVRELLRNRRDNSKGEKPWT